MAQVFCVDITAAMDVFYTAPDVCLIGPDFDLMFYIGWTKIAACIVSLIVLAVYTLWFQGLSCRMAILTGKWKHARRRS